jgi:hypothetical protein
MANTLRDYREEVGKRAGGFYRGTVSINPDLTDALAQRSILCGDLFDLDKGSKGFSGSFAWVGKYKDQRRVRENGYRSLAYTVYTPPTSGTYTLTFYGFGVTAPIAFNANTTAIQTAISTVNPNLTAVTVSAVGSNIILSLPDTIDMEISNGTMISQGGIGALEVNRSFTRALVLGDEFEIHGKIPVTDQDSLQGLNTFINMALHRVWFIDRFPITPGHNSRGVQTFFGLSEYDWLTSSKQIQAVFSPTDWTLVSIFTPPLSSTYTLSLTMGTGVYTTAPLAFDATGAQIQTALNAALVGSNTNVTVAPTTANATYTLTISSTRYATPTFSASAGTITNTRTMNASPYRSSMTWNFQADGESPYLDNYYGAQEGESFFVEAYRPGYSWIAPQASYGVKGTEWSASRVGLVDDYDQAVPPLEDVGVVAYALMAKHLSLTGPQSETEYWRREAKDAAAEAGLIKFLDGVLDDKPRGGGFGAGGGWGSKGYWGRW